MLVAAIAGYGPRAYGQQVCTNQGGQVFLCDGHSADTQNLTNQNNATVETGTDFSVDTLGTLGSAVVITGDGDLSYFDDNNSELTAGYLSGTDPSNALEIIANEANPGDPGSIDIYTNGTLNGSSGPYTNPGSGIFADNNGAGALSITANGTVTGGAEGIEANNSAHGTNLTVTTGPGSRVEGGDDGIEAINSGNGMLTITANGDVEGGGKGIFAQNSGNGTSVTTHGTVEGGSDGIEAQNNGGGTLTVATYGNVSGHGANLAGIRATNQGTDLKVTTAAGTLVYGVNNGIQATNDGDGALTINADSDVTGTNGAGIVADNDGDGMLSITANGNVTGGAEGISADNYGAGALSVTANGDVTGQGATNDGIDASNSGTDLTITTGPSANGVSGGQDGITAVNIGSGILRVTANGDVEGNNGDGIFAQNNNGNGTSVKTYGVVTGDNDGIEAQNLGGGALAVAAYGNVYGTDFAGIRAENDGTTLSVTTGTGTTTRGADGIEAHNEGSQALTIDTSGNVTGTAGNGIYARNGASTAGGAAGTNLTITTDVGTTVQGSNIGIVASNDGTGFIDITANGNVHGTNFAGINAQNGSGTFSRGTDVFVTTGSGSTITSSARTGIYAWNYGTGATTVEVNGAVDGGDDGISVFSAATTTGDVTVRTGQSLNGVEGTSIGIDAKNEGAGDLIIDAQGDVTGNDSFGIRARNYGENLSISTGANSTITSGGGSDGIRASHDGSGTLEIDVNGHVNSFNNAVYATTGTGTTIDVTAGANSDVVGNTNGIHVRNYGATIANVTVDGTVTGNQHGIYGRSTGGTINITVNQGGTVSGTGAGATDSAIGLQTNTTGAVNLTVAGTLNGGGGGAVRFDQTVGQDDRVELQPTFVINGNVFAGGGTDTLAFGGSGNGAFDLGKIDTGAGTQQFRNFETFQVEGGNWTFAGATGENFTVTGGTVMGTGTFGGLTVNGGTVAPGNSIGAMTVNGAFTLGSGAVFEVEANAAGQSDQVIVNGTVNLTGATLKVLAANGNYRLSTSYTIIDKTSAGAVSGRFGAITTNLAFLSPSVNYQGGDGNDVVLTLERIFGPGGNPLSFCSVARTPNQCNVAMALDRFPTGNALFLAVLNQTASGARQAFNALSGEIHATLPGVLADDSRYVREAVLGRLMQANSLRGVAPKETAALGAGGPQTASLDSRAMALGYAGGSHGVDRSPVAFWTRGFGAWGDFGGDRNAASADRDLGGFISGMDANIGGSWRAGLATGASFSNVSVDARTSSADVESYHLGGYLGGLAGPLALRGGGLWAWNDIDTSRAVLFPGFFERQKASYDAGTSQLFGEVAYPTHMGRLALEPFGGLAYVRIDTDSISERGGALASLRGSAGNQDVGYATVGLRAATTMYWGAMEVVPHISAAWQHAFDDITPGAALAFASTGIGFDVTGAPLAQDTALIDAGLAFTLAENATAGISYSGQFGEGVSDNGVKGRFTWLF